jgi:hypothetical protein
MRILSILSGIAVLFTSIAFLHLLHHYYLGASPENLHSLWFWASFVFGAAVELLAFIGGCLLVTRGR